MASLGVAMSKVPLTTKVLIGVGVAGFAGGAAAERLWTPDAVKRNAIGDSFRSKLLAGGSAALIAAGLVTFGATANQTSAVGRFVGLSAAIFGVTSLAGNIASHQLR